MLIYMHVQNIQLFSFTCSTVKMLLGLSYSLFSLLVHVHLCDKKKCMHVQDNFLEKKLQPKCATYFSLSCYTATLYHKLIFIA